MKRFIAAVVAGAIAAAAGCRRDDASQAPRSNSGTESAGESAPVIAFKGLVFNRTCGERNSVLSIDSLAVRDRKLGPFSMRGVVEVEMLGVRARLASCPDPKDANTQEQSGASPPFDELLALPVRDLSLGLVSRVSARSAELVFQDGDHERLRIDAGRIDFALGAGGLLLSGGVWVRAENSSLRAVRAQWLVSDGALHVRGPHQWSDASGQRHARGDAEFLLDRAGGLHARP